MRDGIEPTTMRIARIIVWLGLSAALLSYLRWGTELVSMTAYFKVRRSVPSIWKTFYRGLPDIANGTVLDIVYATALAVVIVGVLALLWLALIPGAGEISPADDEYSPE